MVKDANTLNMLRHRMNMLVHPVDFVDKKMRDILLVPPARKIKETITITEIIEEELHSRDTRAMAAKRAIYEEQVASKKMKKMEAHKEKGPIGMELETFARREKELSTALSKIGESTKFLIEEEHEEYLREMNKEDILALSNPLKEVNDNIMFISLRYLLMLNI